MVAAAAVVGGPQICVEFYLGETQSYWTLLFPIRAGCYDSVLIVLLHF